MKRKLGKYEIVERIGRGGMAEVYKAFNANLARYEAIKVLHGFLADAPEFKTRFEKEAQNIARLKHPHIVQVYDFDFDSATSSYYMVMELIEGGTLKDKLQELAEKGTTMPLNDALRIIREAASALAYAHKQGMIHRDVKPANLMLDKDHRLVLTDFGIAKIVTGPQFTVTGGMVGTPAYMSPEQGMGEAGDERSDLYSLGVILYEILTGRPPYNADTPLALILKHVNQPIPSACDVNPKLPMFIDNIIAKLLAKDPVERYQTADELIVDLDELARRSQRETQRVDVSPTSASSIGIQRPGPTSRTPSGTRAAVKAASDGERNRVFLYLIIGALFVVLIVGGYIVGASNGLFPAVGFLVSATSTDTPSPSPTEMTVPPVTETDAPSMEITDTAVPPTVPVVVDTVEPSPTPTDTEVPANTPIPTGTPTPEISVTPSLTPNATGTLSVMQTATTAACMFDYAIIEQDPADGQDGGFFRVNERYTRSITLFNSGTCPWERNTSLTFIDGESFNAGPRIFIRDQVNPGTEVTIQFEGRLPAKGSESPISGTWQLRTPGQLPIGDPMTISIMVYDPGS